MLSKNKIKLIHSLEKKKHRDECGLFIAEGNKIVEEALLSDMEIELIAATDSFIEEHPLASTRTLELIATDRDTLRKASLLQNPQEALAIIRKPVQFAMQQNYNELSLALDCIQDPGNLGTILRIADWFGISRVICSTDTADAFNSKVVQASMGAIFRIKTQYTDLVEYLSQARQLSIPIYGTFLDGENIYEQALSPNGILVMGNEGKGISLELEKLINSKLHIPSFAINSGSESLNVAVATAICCSEFKRRKN